MTNNDIFKKLRVALKFRDDEIVEILELVDFKISKSELGAFFRNEDHPNYMECGDQVLRNFLNGLVLHLRGTKENPKTPGEVLLAMAGNTPKSVQKPTQRPDQKNTSKRDFKTKQMKKVDTAISSVKYKNKKKS
ncbi:uncharacterized protein DUF1456 [Maribacter spongiicola]|uniref:Uncharacterized protein DUF1456 n=1 Tax=Maribacter spongiicola TaxID=1206753 RepID=A0A4R7K950_9FLAO|nr:DUF1456 family protein [Maribacter spongiicola]TDT47479.1 uncharacterized protein DUF1456 [Maribacter spongiicola]